MGYELSLIGRNGAKADNSFAISKLRKQQDVLMMSVEIIRQHVGKVVMTKGELLQ